MDVINIGQVIRHARKSQALTQAQLASEAGLSRQTLIQIESGDYHDIGLKKLINVLSVLRLSLRVSPPEGLVEGQLQRKGNKEKAGFSASDAALQPSRNRPRM